MGTEEFIIRETRVIDCKALYIPGGGQISFQLPDGMRRPRLVGNSVQQRGAIAMSERENFFNIDALEQGISRQLAEGMTTRIFPGKDAMISIVRIEANRSGKIHSHPQEQWGFCVHGSGLRIQGGEEFPVADSGEAERSFRRS